MNIALVSIAYKGYGKFLPQWCKFISEMTIQPKEVIVVLGQDHKADIKRAKQILPHLQVYEYKAKPSMGKLRNIAVSKTTTTWVQYLSVDDKIEPHAIEEYKKYNRRADYISIAWNTQGLGKPSRFHKARTPNDLYNHNMRGFIVGHSPFRRKFWEMSPYVENDYPNYPFVASMVENGARFQATERACTTYLRRPDSHARTVLPKRAEKAKAVAAKRDMMKRVKRVIEKERKD
jgi:hypothetical protein